MPYHEKPPIDLEVGLLAQTDKAWLVRNEIGQAWIPKSEAELDEAEGVLTLPEWLAINKGLV